MMKYLAAMKIGEVVTFNRRNHCFPFFEMVRDFPGDI